MIDTVRPRNPQASVYTQNTAHIRGKPALTTEAGRLRIAAEEMVQRNVDGVFRFLHYFRMLPGSVELVQQPLFFERTVVQRSPGDGRVASAGRAWGPRLKR